MADSLKELSSTIIRETGIRISNKQLIEFLIKTIFVSSEQVDESTREPLLRQQDRPSNLP